MMRVLLILCFSFFKFAHAEQLKIKIGDTADQVYNAYGKENAKLVDLYGENMFSPALDVYRENKLGLRFSLGPNYSVYQIEVFVEEIRLKNNLGVGSSMAQLRKEYQDNAIVKETHLGILFVPKKERLSFIIDPKFLEQDPKMNWQPSLEGIPNSAKVQSYSIR